MKRTPTSIMILGIIGIILAALGLLGGLCGSIYLLFVTPSDAMNKALRADTPYEVFTVSSALFAIPFYAFFLSASIASLRLAKWARMAMIICSAIAVAKTLFGVVFNFVHVLPLMQRSLPPDSPPPVLMAEKIAPYTTSCWALVAMIFPICIFYFFTRPKIVDAFEGRLPPDSADSFPQDPLPPSQNPPQSGTFP